MLCGACVSKCKTRSQVHCHKTANHSVVPVPHGGFLRLKSQRKSTLSNLKPSQFALSKLLFVQSFIYRLMLNGQYLAWSVDTSLQPVGCPVLQRPGEDSQMVDEQIFHAGLQPSTQMNCKEAPNRKELPPSTWEFAWWHTAVKCLLGDREHTHL